MRISRLPMHTLVALGGLLASGCSDLPADEAPPAVDLSPSMEITFEPFEDGYRILDSRADSTLLQLDASRSGFVAGFLPAVEMERRMAGRALDGPYRVGYSADGVPMLLDPSTGFVMDLEAFGVDTRALFQPILRALPTDAGEGA